jgi:HEAT repeat protein
MSRFSLIGVVGTLLILAVAAQAGDERSIKGKSYKEWIRRLQDQDLAVRTEAAQVFAQAGPSSPAAVAALLVAAKKDADLNVRVFAIGALGLSPVASRDVVSSLVQALKDAEPAIRSEAAQALGRLGVGAKEAAPALADAMKDNLVRVSALRALGQMGPEAKAVIPVLIETLKAENNLPAESRTTDGMVAYALGSIGPAAREAIPALIDSLKDPHAGTRLGATLALGALGPLAKDAVPGLLRVRKDPDERIRLAVLESLLAVAPAAREVQAALLEAIRDRSRSVQLSAISGLQLDPPVGDEAFGVLFRAGLDISDPDIRGEVGRLLATIDPSGKKAAAGLMMALKGQDAQQAILLLRQLSLGPAEAVPVLLEALKHQQRQVRSEAVSCLSPYDPKVRDKPGTAGPRDKVVIAALIRALSDPDLRGDAMQLLTMWGPAAQDAAPALLPLLKDDSAPVRASAVTVLGAVGAERKEALSALISAAKDGDAGVRWKVAWGLRTAKPTPEVVAVLIRFLQDPDARVSQEAAQNLEAAGAAAKEAAPALVALLKHDNKSLRGQAVTALAAVGAESKDTAAALIQAAKDADAGVRRAVARALRTTKLEFKEVVPILAELVKDPNAQVRQDAATALVARGSEGVAVLCQTLKDRDLAVRVRQEAATALGRFGPAAADVVPALIEDLKDADVMVRARAASVLAEIGPAARAAAPLLAERLKAPEVAVRVQAARALWRIDRRPEVVPVLIEILKVPEPSPSSFWDAVRFLGVIGPPANDAIPALVRHLDLGVENSNGSFFYYPVTDALIAIGPLAAPTLIRIVNDPWEPAAVRREAINALGGLGASAGPAAPDLIRAMKDRNNEVRARAMVVLGQLGAKEAVPALIEALKDSELCAVAASALGAIGPSAREALPALKRALSNPDPNVRLTFVEALKKIEAKPMP